MFSHRFLKHKIIFLHFWILQHVCKTPKGIGQYSKNYKNFIFGEGIYLLFTTNVWIKKSLKGWISKILLGIINPHTFLKEALIIIEDISKLIYFFLSTIYESQTFEILREKWAFKAHGISLDFYPKSIDEPKKNTNTIAIIRQTQTPSSLP